MSERPGYDRRTERDLTVTLSRLFVDDDGETHIAPIALPSRAPDNGPRRVGLVDVPTTTLTISRLLERKPDGGYHPAPRRQLVVILQGQLTVTTTSGDRRQFDAGDCLLAEDLEGKGHVTQQTGAEPLSTLTIGIADDWELPVN